MLTDITNAAQCLAVWRVAETGATQESANPADLKEAAAHAHQNFINAAYAVGFALVPLVLAYDRSIVTPDETTWTATPKDGGMLILQLYPNRPGHALIPEPEVPVESFLQLMIDLPFILATLRVR